MSVYVLADYTRRPAVRHRAYAGIARCNHLTVDAAYMHARLWAKWHPKAAPIDYDALPMCRRCQKASAP